MRFGFPLRLRAGLRSGLRGDDIFALFPLALLWIVFLGIVPIVVAILVGLVQNTSVNGARLPAPGYPAFPMLSCGLLVPALLLAVLLVRTFTWPLRTVETIRRYEIAGLSIIGAVVLARTSALDERFLASWATRLNSFTMAVFVAVCILAFARAAAGSLHLVPRSWRVEPEKPKRRRRS